MHFFMSLKLWIDCIVHNHESTLLGNMNVMKKNEILGVIKQKMKLTFELFPGTYAKMTKQDLGLHELWPFFSLQLFYL